MKLRENDIKQELKNFLGKELSDLSQRTKQENSEKLKKMDAKIDSGLSSIKGGIFHLQGARALKDGNFKGALADYIVASDSYLQGEDFLNLQRLLDSIVVYCLPKVRTKDIASIKIENNADIDRLIKNLEVKNEKDIFTNNLIRLKTKLSEIPLSAG